eukprot:gnl/TRDRNA2_/TRDRNA2_91881_c0_seq1.p1 gnl/TRDRNA2_/TRDRNA2_91881_c0~~gnl/TRDRNA2_/TRDRNA2_91881_c0_seq1.p1  ORF type:complete len:152 (+),score=28.25 gnl/TRDRNA2_/TRDRNA2_91881_c0_seq1:45-500(+)
MQALSRCAGSAATTATYGCAAPGKYAWQDDEPNANADAVVVTSCAITKYSWSDGARAVSVYVELDGLDELPSDAITVKSGMREACLSVLWPEKTRILVLRRLAHEICGAEVKRKTGQNTVVIKLRKKEEREWWRLLEGAVSCGEEDVGCWP